MKAAAGKKKPMWTCPECEEIVPRTYAHSFRSEGPAETDEDFAAILGDAYAVGCQEHLDDSATRRSHVSQ